MSLVFEGRVPTVALGKRSLTKADFPSETEVLGNRVPSVYHTVASSEPEVDLATGAKCPRNERRNYSFVRHLLSVNYCARF